MYGATSSYRPGNLDHERQWMKDLPVFNGDNLHGIGLEFLVSFPLLKYLEELLDAQNVGYRVRMMEGYAGYKVDITIQTTDR